MFFPLVHCDNEQLFEEQAAAGALALLKPCQADTWLDRDGTVTP